MKKEPFPILSRAKEKEYIPWSVLEPFEERAMNNHGGQTLKRLAERGGLSWLEVLVILEDQDWKTIPRLYNGKESDEREENAKQKVLQLIEDKQKRIEAIENNNCVKCSMLDLLHYHTAEQAKNFKFGCGGEKFEACKQLRRMEMSGPPGYRGYFGDETPSKEEIRKRQQEDEAAMREFNEKTKELQAIINSKRKTPICMSCKKELKYGDFAFNQEMCWDCFTKEVNKMKSMFDKELHKDILHHLYAITAEVFNKKWEPYKK